LRAKRSKLLNFNNIKLTAKELKELSLNNKDFIKELLPASKRANSCANLEVYTCCSIKGLIYKFKEDSYKINTSKSSCKSCVYKKVTYYKVILSLLFIFYLCS